MVQIRYSASIVIFLKKLVYQQKLPIEKIKKNNRPILPKTNNPTFKKF